MKSSKKLRKYFTISSLALISSAMLVGLFSSAPKEAKAEEEIVSPTETTQEASWFRLEVDEVLKTFDLHFSPSPRDYKQVNKTSLKNLLSGSIQGLKNLFSKQVTFATDIKGDPAKYNKQSRVSNDELAFDLSDTITEENRSDVFVDLTKSILYGWTGMPGGDGSSYNTEVSATKLDEFTLSVTGEYESPSSNGYFLKDTLAYLIACDKNGATVEDETVLASRLEDVKSVLIAAYGDEAKANTAVDAIYNEAKDIAFEGKAKTVAFAKILGTMESSTIPAETIVTILGPENCLNGIRDVFADPDIPVSYAAGLLNNLSTGTVGAFCDAVNNGLTDAASGSNELFSRDFMYQAIKDTPNSRLLDIAGALKTDETHYGLSNVKLILSKPVQYDTENTSKGITKSSPLGVSGSTYYSDFSNEITQLVVSRMSLKDYFKSMKKLTVIGDDRQGVSTEYVILEKPVGNNLQVKTSRIVDLLNALPRMKEVRNFADNEMRLEFDVLVDTVVNEEDQQIQVSLDIGFMEEKDCKYIRKLAGLLDDTFDLAFSYNKTTRDFFVDLKTRNPQFVTNIYKWMADSGFVTDDNFLVEVWDLLFKTPDDIADWLEQKTFDEIKNILKDKFDYEKFIDTFTYAEELNEMFNVSKFTEERLQKFVELLNRAIKKASTFTYDGFLQFLKDVGLGKVADKLDTEKLRNYYEKFHNFLVKLDGKNITLDAIRDLTNERIGEYIEKLTGYESKVMKVRDYAIKLIRKLPERVREKSVMDAYKGNGKFEGTGTVGLNWEKFIKKLPSGDKLWDVFNGSVTGAERPATFTLHLDAQFKNMYSITYDWSDHSTNDKYSLEEYPTMSKKGVLSLGTDNVKTLAGITKVDGKSVVHWVEKDNVQNRVDVMQGKDIVVVPEVQFDIDIVNNTPEYYTGEGSLKAEPSAPIQYSYTYQWQKLNAEQEWEDMDGETNQTLERKNVADNGKYRCVVKNGDDVATMISGEETVNIQKAKVTMAGIEWNSPLEFAFDGTDKTVTIKEASIPETISKTDISYENNVKKDMGEYTAKATFKLVDEDNYEFDGDNFVTTPWKIVGTIIEATDAAEWGTTKAFLYDGQEHCPEVLIKQAYADKVQVDHYETAKLGEETYTSGGATEIGHYVTKVFLKTNSPSDVIHGNLAVFEWKIYKNVDLSSLKWSETSAFDYDGNPHKVEVEGISSIPEIEVTYKTSDGTSETEGNSKVEKGNYKTTATVSLKSGFDPELYILINDGVSGAANAKEWSISYKVITINSIEWNVSLDNPFTFNNADQTAVPTINTTFNDAVDFEYLDDSEYVHTAKNKGNYKTKIKIFIKDAYKEYYVFDDNSQEKFETHEWKINPKQVTVSNITWNSNEFTYDGTEHQVTVTFDTDDSSAINVAYAGNAATDAGEYTANATLSVISDNYVLVGDSSSSQNWKINPKQVTVSNITWSSSEFTYDGEQHEVTVSFDKSDDVVVVSYTGNSATDAGEYTANVTFSVNDSNYVLKEEYSSSLEWKINPKQVVISDITWSTSEFTYDGETHEVKVSFEASEEGVVTYTYGGTTSAIDAGNYEATVSFSVNSSNYVLKEEYSSSLNWKINKQQISIDGIVWNYSSPITYDGNTHTVEVTSYSHSDIVDVSYDQNSAKEVGKYTTTATFKVDEENANNYEIVGENTSILNWEIVKKPVELHYVFTSVEKDAYNNPNAVVTVEKGIEENLTLHAELKTDGNPFAGMNINFKELIGSDGEVKYAYVLVTTNGDQVYVIKDNNVTIKFLIPENLRGTEFFVIVKNSDGTVSKVTPQISQDGKFATITGTEVKDIGLVTKKQSGSSITDNPELLALIGIAAAAQVGLLVTGIVLVKKHKKNKNKSSGK